MLIVYAIIELLLYNYINMLKVHSTESDLVKRAFPYHFTKRVFTNDNKNSANHKYETLLSRSLSMTR